MGGPIIWGTSGSGWLTSPATLHNDSQQQLGSLTGNGRVRAAAASDKHRHQRQRQHTAAAASAISSATCNSGILACVLNSCASVVMSFTPEEVEEHRTAFDLFDKDGNGSISAEELGAVLKAQGVELTSDQVADLIKKYDTNFDNGVDFEEFLRLLAESDIASAARYGVVFKSLDTDGDGTVSAAELRASLEKRGLGLTDEQLNDLVQQADADGNGTLSFEEFLKFINKK